MRLARETFGNREAETRSLAFPPEWSAAEPVLDTDSISEVTIEAPSDLASGDVSPDDGLQDIVLIPRARLSPASFADVQRTIRVWADP